MVSTALRLASFSAGALVLAGITVMYPIFAHADTTTSTTSVYVSASTGGNTIIGGGTITQGTPTSTVVVRSIQNGVVVDNVRIVKTDGSPIIYKSKNIRIGAWAR